MAKLLTPPIIHYLDDNGEPLAGGQLFFYVAGTSTKQDTYADEDLVIPNENPMILNARGETDEPVFLSNQGVYKVVLASATDTDPPTSPIWSVDEVSNLLELVDDDGNSVIVLDGVANPVNWVTVTNAATGNKPIISVDGETNVGLTITTKGTGAINAIAEDILLKDVDNTSSIRTQADVGVTVSGPAVTMTASTGNASMISTAGDVVLTATGDDVLITATDDITLTSAEVKLASNQPITDTNANELLKFSATASAVNEVTVTNAATATNPTLSATGGDTNVGINLQSKGTGTYNLLGTVDQEARLKLFEDTSNGTNSISINAPAIIASDKTITLADETFTLRSQVWDLIATATASNSATLDFTSISNSTYRTHVLVLSSMIPQTDATSLTLRVSVAASFLSTSIYDYAIFAHNSAGASAVSGGNATAGVILMEATSWGNNTNEHINGVVYLHNLSDAAIAKSMVWQGHGINATAASVSATGGCTFSTTSAIDGIRILSSSGNITSGEVRLYGIRNA